MERIDERPGALDVHKASVTACVRVWQGRELQERMAEFATTVHGLLALRDWLEALGVRSRWRPPAFIGNAPRGALLYPRRSRDELEGSFVGLMAYPDPKGERYSSLPEKRRSCPGAGVRRRGTRVIWRKLDLLEAESPEDEKTHPPESTRYRRHALRRHAAKVVATFGVWSVAQ